MKRGLIYLAVGLIIGLGACLLAERALDAWREGGCDVVSKTLTAPGDGFRATLTHKTCAWGFGLVANDAFVKLEKPGPEGWFENIEIETDEPVSESPTMKWTDPTHLEVVIKSDHISGSIQRMENGLSFTRRYVSAR